MPPVITRVTFTEENDARPTYICAAIAALVLMIGRAVQDISSSHTRSIYTFGACLALLAAIPGMYCVLGCIWHPLPKARRTDGELTNLHLSGVTQAESSPSAPSMFASVDDQVAADDEESVDMTQVELRDPIQWGKMALVLTAVGIDILLMVFWSR